MAEVKRVLGKMQLDTEGGLARATYEMKAAGKAVSSFTGEIGVFTGEIGVTNAELGSKAAAGNFTWEIGVTKAEPGNKEAAGSCSITKAKLGSKEPAGSCSITKAKLWSKEPAGSCTREIGVTKAELGNKEAAGSSTREIGVTKASLVNKDAAGSFAREIGFIKAAPEIKEAAAGSGMVTEASWIDYVILSKKDQELLAPKQWRKAEPAESMITKEKVPDSFVDILIKRRPFNQYPPINEMAFNYLSKHNPKLLELRQMIAARRSCCVDLHHDILRQQAEKGFAEVGVDFTHGVKNIFILP